MINIADSKLGYEYYPVVLASMDSFIDEPPTYPGFKLSRAAAKTVIDIIYKKDTKPVFFDFWGVWAGDNSRAFANLDPQKISRDIYLIGMNHTFTFRAGNDDNKGLFKREQEKSHLYPDNDELLSFLSYRVTQDDNTPLTVEDISSRTIYRDFYKNLIDQACTKTKAMQQSSGVQSKRYFDAKRIFSNPKAFQLVLFQLARDINFSTLKFDTIVSASPNGAFLASPLGLLLDCGVRSWGNLGPKYVPQNVLKWKKGKPRKCLFVADMISLGSELKRAETFLASMESEIVGTASIATYVPPFNGSDSHITLAGSDILKSIGYEILLP